MKMRTIYACLILTTSINTAVLAETVKNPLMKDFFSDKTTVTEVQKAIDSGASLIDRDRYGNNPLHLAIENHAPIDVIKFLIENGAPVNQPKGKKGNLVTHTAAYAGNLELLSVLKNAGADFLAVDDIKETPLHWLAYNENPTLDMMNFLINEGIDPNAQSQTGNTPASAMAWNTSQNPSEILDALIAAGSDPYIVNADGQDMFMASISYAGKGDYLQRLFDMSEDPYATDNKGLSGILLATQWGINKERLQFLEEHDFDIYAKNDKGENAIILNAESGDVESLSMLLERGFDINSTSANGNTPLLEALVDPEYINVDMALAVLDKGGHINHADTKGVTPLMRLLTADLEKMEEENAGKVVNLIDTFIARGAELTACDAGGATTLIYAVKGNQPIARIRQIIAANVDVNARDGEGNTALMYAAMYAKDPAVVEALLDAGADISVADVFGDTASVMAGDNINLQGAQVLERLL